MKKILLSLPQIEWSCFLASHIQGIMRKFVDGPVSFDLLEKNVMDSLTFSHVVGVHSCVEMCSLNQPYDMVVNLDTDPMLAEYFNSKYENVVNMQAAIYGNESKSIWSSISDAFQVQCEFPIFQFSFLNKTRNNRSESGVAIKNDSLRMHIKNAFFADDNRLWHIPVRINLIKRYDECNTAKNIVTDDIFCALSACHMGKDVIFLKTNSAVPNIAVANKIHVQNVDNFINATYTKKTS